MKLLTVVCPVAMILTISGAVPGVAANAVTIRNGGATPVQIGFDRGTAQTISPRETATVSLGAGQHTAQCRFEGAFDGCNIQEQFNLGDGQRTTIDLLPVYTLQHAVTLAQQGTLRVETRRDAVWAMRAQDIAGSGADCASYETGKLAGVSTRVRSGMTVDELAVATQQLCGEARPVVTTTIGGEKLYVQPNFLIFRDRNGHPILIRQ